MCAQVLYINLSSFTRCVQILLKKPQFLHEVCPSIIHKPQFLHEVSPDITQRPQFLHEVCPSIIHISQFLHEVCPDIIHKPQFVHEVCPSITHEISVPSSGLSKYYTKRFVPSGGVPIQTSSFLSHCLYVTKKRDGQLTGSLVIAHRPGSFNCNILRNGWISFFFML
jgi:hypothetical protein